MGNVLYYPSKTESKEIDKIISDIEKQSEIEAGYITDVVFGKKETNPLVDRYRNNLYDDFIRNLDEI